MSKRYLLTLLACLLLISLAHVTPLWADSGDNDVLVTVLESNDLRTIVRFEVSNFEQHEVLINGQTWYQITSGEEATMLNRAEPSLPQVCRAIIIPDKEKMAVRIIDAKYTDYPGVPVAPSKGNFDRTIDPDDVPFEFGPVYKGADWYPADLAGLREPYILRDYRGTVIELNAFQYNPAGQTLRVYTSVTLEVFSTGTDYVNTIDNRRQEMKLVPDFDMIYRNRFINYEYMQGKYTPVEDAGDMLIITYDNFATAMQPLVEWKRQKGIKTTLVNVSTIGNTSTAIKNYIQNFYNTTDLAWILLVGDYSQVTTAIEGGGGTDPNYTRLNGTDYYPDAFIGRFSAENVAQAELQVLKTINYEKTPFTGDWHHKGTGIGSDEGAGVGHNGEADYVHIGYIRNDLMAFTYTEVDQIYAPSATAAQVTAAVNNGRSFMNYCGHGSDTYWVTTGFSNSNVNALTNSNMLPFIISVACVNGNFTSQTCFAEAWLRANQGGVPTGAVATYMSTINQSWVPPMHAQDEATDLLVSMQRTTFGGICFNGSCKMNDLSGSSGYTEFSHWTIFGDPSLLLCTDTPAPLTVNHSPAILFTLPSFAVEVPGVEGALCAVYYEGILYGAAYTNASGQADITFTQELPVGANVFLTVTAFNYAPYITNVQVISPDGPYIVLDNVAHSDAGGNNDGIIDAAEPVTLTIQLKNVGPDDAYDVVTTLSSTSPYVTITDNTETYGTIPGENGTAAMSDGFAVEFAAGTPDGHVAPFEISVEGSDTRLTWPGSFALTVRSQPDINIPTAAIDQSVPVAGTETFELTINNFGPSTLSYNVIRKMFSGKRDMEIIPARQAVGYHSPADSKDGVSEPLFAGEDKGSGGPDAYGYFWVDSDHADGPAVNWIDITGIGTLVDLNDDDSTGVIPMGFDFPFYEGVFNSLQIGSNGIITFGKGSKAYSNTGLPNAAQPNNLIAFFWDDLDPEQYGDIYYYYDAVNDRFIVSYVNVAFHYSTAGTGSVNAQVILTPDGAIEFQYGVMSPGSDVLTSSTIGIENSTGTDGLQVVYNAPYIHDNMAIRFKAADWLSVSPAIGDVPSFGSTTVDISFNPGDLEMGDYSGELTITSNDPDQPSLNIPVTMSVTEPCICGDANNDGIYNLLDIVFLIDFKFKFGPAPVFFNCSDVNGDGAINVLDITYLIANKYQSGPEPGC